MIFSNRRGKDVILSIEKSCPELLRFIYLDCLQETPKLEAMTELNKKLYLL